MRMNHRSGEGEKVIPRVGEVVIIASELVSRYCISLTLLSGRIGYFQVWEAVRIEPENLD